MYPSIHEAPPNQANPADGTRRFASVTASDPQTLGGSWSDVVVETFSPEFLAGVVALQRDVAEMVLAPGGAANVVHRKTKLGGVPWWPASEDRPRCRDCRNYMAFVAQIALHDVPGQEAHRGLVSFHYCQHCVLEGNMAFGGRRLVAGYDTYGGCGYDVRVLLDDLEAPDERGSLEESPIPSKRVSLVRKREVPDAQDFPRELDLLAPEDFPFLEHDFDENVGGGLKHVRRCKVGGWPTWQQSSDWPVASDGKKTAFIGQIDWAVGEQASWCNGGYAYLFLDLHASPPVGELMIQTT